jgi:hypothetical protein
MVFFFTKMDGYQKKCETQTKNVTKMNVIIKGVYCNIVQNQHRLMMRRLLKCYSTISSMVCTQG